MHTIFSSEPITAMSIKTWHYFFLSTLFSDSSSSHYSSSSFPPLHFLISFFSSSLLFLPKRYLFSSSLFPFPPSFLSSSYSSFPSCFGTTYGPVVYSTFERTYSRSVACGTAGLKRGNLLPWDIWSLIYFLHSQAQIERAKKFLTFLFFTTFPVNGINTFSSLRKTYRNIFDSNLFGSY